MLPHYQWQGRDDDLDHGDHDEDDEESQVIGGGGGDPVRAPFYGIPFPSKSRHFILLQVICRGKTAHFRLQLTTQEGKREQQDDHGGGDDDDDDYGDDDDGHCDDSGHFFLSQQ